MANESARTSFLLRLLQLEIYNQMVDRLRQFDLTPFQYMTLSRAGHRGTLSGAELARRFRVTPQSMNEVITALEAKQLIERRESPDHGRILNVHLTRAGARLLQKCDQAIDLLEDEAFGELSAAERALFRDIMQRALAALAAHRRREDRAASA